MDRRLPNHPSSHHDQADFTGRRRARSYSQPIASPVPVPDLRPQDSFDFFGNAAYEGQPNHVVPFPHVGTSVDEEQLLRFLAMSEDNQGPQTHSHQYTQLPGVSSLMAQQPGGFQMAPPASMHHLPSQPPSGPLVQQAFIAWLQYMQLQSQLQQQQPQQPHQAHPVYSHQPSHSQHQQPQATNAPFQQNVFPTRPSDVAAPLRTDSRSPETNQSTNPPSPENDEGADVDASANISEEKRRRNTAASARFRVKKKQWTMNLERSITELSTRVEELEREAAELRRENGWLKEIVMLKSKRFGGQAPNPEAGSSLQPAPSEPPNDEDLPGSDGGDGEHDAEVSIGDKGKGVQR